MLNVRLAGDHLYGKLLFTWLSLVVSLIVFLCHPFSWMGSVIELSQFLRVCLPTHTVTRPSPSCSAAVSIKTIITNGTKSIKHHYWGLEGGGA